MNFKNSFHGKTVLITGHTGFKGSWLTAWLKLLGAKVVGISLDPSTEPSHFTASEISKDIVDYRLDIRSYSDIQPIILKHQPDFVFHLAAQALVGVSYEEPIQTWMTNVIGTLNVLEALRLLKNKCVAVFITSDKCYDNVEWLWGYRENDKLGGPDPYSASKASAEILIRSHFKSFFCHKENNVLIGSARAGNVIGGGDWSNGRLVPDCVKAWSKKNNVELRYPNSTRPWQHVLEPLSGYLLQASIMANSLDQALHGESFNFGPLSDNNHSVLDLVKKMANHWDQVKWTVKTDANVKYESSLLKLNCDKALHLLHWRPVMSFDETVEMTVSWYQTYYKDPNSVALKTLEQIHQYSNLALDRNLIWTK
jgi:CDP-glucose 4,6-dehydratase